MLSFNGKNTIHKRFFVLKIQRTNNGVVVVGSHLTRKNLLNLKLQLCYDIIILLVKKLLK